MSTAIEMNTRVMSASGHSHSGYFDGPPSRPAPEGYAAMPDDDAGALENPSAPSEDPEEAGVGRGWQITSAGAGVVAAGALIALIILAVNPKKPSPPERPRWWK